jgi:two-component system, chemotaxis family, chemotaxis protein CheY
MSGVAVRVLVVDDARSMRAILKDILEAAGFEVVGEASNGREAVARYRQLAPALVTMDIVLPVMDGIQATREILQIDPGAIIVMCTALGQEALLQESFAAGARDFIVKPFTPEKVLPVLASAAGGRKG